MNRKLARTAALVAVVIGISLVVGCSSSDRGSPEAEELPFVRADSRRLSTGSSDVVLVEFLDYECEACRAAHPVVEQLRSEHGDEVTFVVRNFPLHSNSVAAARAAEAAAEQGAFEEMYSMLFETQPQWGERSDSQEAVFLGFAEDLGLDLEAFREVFDDPATIDKIEQDQADGQALGVTGTPTFFLNGEKLELNTYEQLIDRVEQAVGG